MDDIIFHERKVLVKFIIKNKKNMNKNIQEFSDAELRQIIISQNRNDNANNKRILRAKIQPTTLKP